MSDLGRIIQKQLEARGWTQTDLAQRLGVNPTNVSRWLSGQRPEFDSCLAIALFLSINPEVVMRATGNEELWKRYKTMRALETEHQVVFSGVPDKHIEAHRLLQSLLDAGGVMADTVNLLLQSLLAHKERKKGHGPHLPRPH